MVKKKIYFITGNKGKFKQAKDIIPEIEQIDFDLPEIQELDSKKIIEEKLKEASKISKENFFCEDVSLSIKCLGGLPGPLIKWFLESLGTDGIFNTISKFEDKSAIAKTIVGYSNGSDIVFFEEEMEGEIVKPAGENGYGWDFIFKPKGHDKTLAEMNHEEKKTVTMKTKVFSKLKEYLENKN